jgi:hypothetical protein
VRNLKRKLAKYRREAAVANGNSYAASTTRPSELSRRNSVTDDDTSLAEIRIKNLERTVSELKKVSRFLLTLTIDRKPTYLRRKTEIKRDI